MGAGARADSVAVLRDLISRPAQASRLIRIILDAFIARSEMQRVRRLLGPHFGLAELSHPELRASELAESGLAPSAIAS
jgi:hypothetical protein